MSSSTTRSSRKSGSTSPSRMSARSTRWHAGCSTTRIRREAAIALAQRIKAGIRANVGECLTSLGRDRPQPPARQARVGHAEARRAGRARPPIELPQRLLRPQAARHRRDRRQDGAPAGAATASTTSASFASAARATRAAPGAASMATGSGIRSTASTCPTSRRRPHRSGTATSCRPASAGSSRSG